MAFQISLSPRVIADAENAYLWFKEQNPTFADEWFQRLSDALASLEQLPARCPVAPESQELDREIRQLLYRKSKKTTFRILFGLNRGMAKIVELKGHISLKAIKFVFLNFSNLT